VQFGHQPIGLSGKLPRGRRGMVSAEHGS
jgi:hypothetical protein